jgi:hypothetical protein
MTNGSDHCVLIYSIVAYGGQHASKKLKMGKQGIDISQETSVASQMSNMAHPARFIKIIANRDRGRKCKALKVLSSLRSHKLLSLLVITFVVCNHFR